MDKLTVKTNTSCNLWRWILCCLGLFSVITSMLMVGVYVTMLRQGNIDTPRLDNVTKEVATFNWRPNRSHTNITILYYNPPTYVRIRNAADRVDFNLCDFNNCQLTLNQSLFNGSDAVIFDGRFSQQKQAFYRVPGQVWIFSAHESPANYMSGSWRREWKSSFNLTMTYDKYYSDIYWPYGEIRERPQRDIKNFTSIFYSKTNDVLIINSHCYTNSKRENFIKKLSKYVNVDTLGKCGEKWKCGRHYRHDNCFSIINKYKFYLSFENSLCRSYFTEKFFENFNYDSIMVVRGGQNGQAVKEFPEGTFISTDSFNSTRDLGIYLKRLSSSVTEYTRILERKSYFYSPDYKQIFQETMCRVCHRLNNLHRTNETIPDIKELVYRTIPCRTPTDLGQKP